MSQALHQTFVDEATELLRRACTAAMVLETAGDGERQEPYEAILRELHTLKGAAGSVNLAVGDHIAGQVHALEDRLVQSGGPAQAQALMGSVIEGLDEMSELVRRLGLGEAFEAPDPAGGHEPPQGVGEIEGLFLFEEEDEDVQPLAAQQPAPPVEPDRRQTILKRSSARKGRSASRELLRVRPERIDDAHDLVSELMVAQLQAAAQTQEVVGVRDRLTWASRDFRALQTALWEKRRSLGSLWIKLEPLLNRLQRDLTDLRQETSNLARRGTSLRDRNGALVSSVEASIRTLRVMPIQPFLEELLPVVREAARISGRRARLVLDGGGSEADRHVLVGLRDPLLHLVRNSVAHGVGDPARRQADGRDPVGTISIEARCLGPRLRIAVKDDGYGVDVDKVVRRGAALGLVAPDAVLDDSGVLALLAQPSFSTQSEADALSGRGVGMNVVLDAVERLGGRMELNSNPGTGACFVIDVPIAAATSRGLIVLFGDGQFGFPLANVERVVRLRAQDLQGNEHPFVHIEGEPVAVASLGHFVDQPIVPLGDERRPAIVVQAYGARLVLLVDDIPGESELMVKPMPAAFLQHPLVSGGAVQADGSVLLILDLPAIVQKVQREGLPVAPPPEPQAPAAPGLDAVELRC